MDKAKAHKILDERISSLLFYPILICFLVMAVSPIIWIWLGWTLAWKVALSGFISLLFLALIQKFLKNLISEVVNEFLDNKANTRKSFKERLEEEKIKSKND